MCVIRKEICSDDWSIEIGKDIAYSSISESFGGKVEKQQRKMKKISKRVINESQKHDVFSMNNIVCPS